ncbi:hypothetical protein KY338_00965 [Candidatus Woesearchaeota archaeon]|nr:hypothetical protein [Candidatus Woesearchaeota archaeon]MBW3006168.1 hypothetical protein [Candidatus Woesearchaeota archaeon]
MALRILNNKKGTWAWADFLYFFFYVALTFVLALSISHIPDSILNSVLQKGNLEYTINNDRMDNMLAYKDPYSGRLNYLVLESDNMISNETVKNLLIFPKDKKIAVALSLDGKKYYWRKKYYDIAKPLTPITYESIVNTRMVQLPSNVWGKLTIEQVYKPS